MKVKEIIAKVKQFYKEGHGLSVSAKHCYYWYPEKDTACFIGCLLPPEIAEKMELDYSGRSISIFLSVDSNGELYSSIQDPEVFDAVRGLLPEDLSQQDGVEFLQKLQSRHDNCPDITDFLEYLNDSLNRLEASYAEKLIT